MSANRLTIILLLSCILAVRLGDLPLSPAPSRLFLHFDIGHDDNVHWELCLCQPGLP